MSSHYESELYRILSETNPRSNNCGICTAEAIRTGRQKLLHVGGYYFIDENNKTALIVGEGYSTKRPIFSARRMTLNIFEHTTDPGEKLVEQARNDLLDFMTAEFGLQEENILTRVTMLGVPEHFHVHGYVLPFFNGSGEVLCKDVYASAGHMCSSSVPDYVHKIMKSGPVFHRHLQSA